MAAGRSAIRGENVRLDLREIGAKRARRQPRRQPASITTRAAGDEEVNYKENKDILLIATLRHGQFGLTIAFKSIPIVSGTATLKGSIAPEMNLSPCKSTLTNTCRLSRLYKVSIGASLMSVNAGKQGNSENAAEVRLLSRIADNDGEAFETLFDIYRPRLFTFLFRLTRSHGAAEELANDVLLTLWKDAGRFRGESKVSTWIFGIAYRQALAHLRKRKLKLVPLVEHDITGEANGAQLEREDWVRRGVEKLPPKQKLTVMLVYFLGLSCEETAKASGVPVNTVKTRMFHARRKMKRYLVMSADPQDQHKEFRDV